MTSGLLWHFEGFPEGPWRGQDAGASLTVEKTMAAFQHAVASGDRLHLACRSRSLTAAISATDSPWQQVRGTYLLGRAALLTERWAEARALLAHIMLPPEHDAISPLIITRALALAANYDHRYPEAIRHYTSILQDWKTLAPHEQAHYLAEDGAAFTCNIIRQTAQTWFYMGAAETGRALLEKQALPLVDQYYPLQPTPLECEAARQSERNWRLLRLYVPWMAGQCAGWQVRFSDEPILYEEDLYQAYVAVRETALLSQIMPEGRGWTQDILTTAAEMLTQLSLLTSNRPLQVILCQTAREHLGSIERDVGSPAPNDELRSFVLRLPWYELDFAERRARDALFAADDLCAEILALRAAAQARADPGFRLFCARCTWLLGQIEATRQEFDEHARANARHYFLEALQLLPPQQEFTSLIQRGIQADLRRFG